MLVYRRVGISAQEKNDGPEFTTACESPGRARLQNVVEQAKAIRVIHDLCTGCIILTKCSSMIIPHWQNVPNKFSQQMLPASTYQPKNVSPDAAPEA